MPHDGARGPAQMNERLELRIVFPSDPMAVRAALGSVMAGLDWLGPSQDARGRVELTLAEALNNVVEHAYDGGAGLIEVELAHAETGLRVEVRDDGRAFPDGLPPPGDPPEPTLLPEGGFGWTLLYALAEDLRYRREEGRNHLTFGVGLAEAVEDAAAA